MAMGPVWGWDWGVVVHSVEQETDVVQRKCQKGVWHTSYWCFLLAGDTADDRPFCSFLLTSPGPTSIQFYSESTPIRWSKTAGRTRVSSTPFFFDLFVKVTRLYRGSPKSKRMFNVLSWRTMENWYELVNF